MVPARILPFALELDILLWGFAQKRVRVPPRVMNGPPQGEFRALFEVLNLWIRDQAATLS